MKFNVQVLFFIFLISNLTHGCKVKSNFEITGTWVCKDLQEMEHVTQFDAAQITFNNDNTFIEYLIEGKEILPPTSGKYSYDKLNNKISCQSHGETTIYFKFISNTKIALEIVEDGKIHRLYFSKIKNVSNEIGVVGDEKKIVDDYVTLLEKNKGIDLIYIALNKISENGNKKVVHYLLKNIGNKKTTDPLEQALNENFEYTVGMACYYAIIRLLAIEPSNPENKLDELRIPEYLQVENIKNWWELNNHVPLKDLKLLILKERIAIGKKEKLNVEKYEELLIK